MFKYIQFYRNLNHFLIFCTFSTYCDFKKKKKIDILTEAAFVKKDWSIHLREDIHLFYALCFLTKSLLSGFYTQRPVELEFNSKPDI